MASRRPRGSVVKGMEMMGLMKEPGKVNKQNACLSFLGVSVFYGVFLFAQFQHHRTTSAFFIDQTFQSILDNVHPTPLGTYSGVVPPPTTKALKTVSVLDDVYEWVSTSFAPSLWEETKYGRGIVRGMNRLIGGLRFRQSRFEEAPCAGVGFRDGLLDIYNATCFDEGIFTTTADMSLGPSTTAPDQEGFTNYWLDIEQDVSAVQAHVAHLKEKSFASPATFRFSIQGLFYNGQFGMLILVTVNFEQSRSGLLTIYRTIQTLPELVYSDGWASLALWADVFVVGTLALLTIIEFYQLFVAWKWGALKSHVFSLYKLVTVFVIVIGFGITFFFAWLSAGLEDVSTRIPALLAQGAGNSADYAPGLTHSEAWLSRHADLNQLVDDVDYYAFCLRYSQLAAFWYSLLLLYKFFEGFEANEHLATIMKTLRHASADLLHFAIIFMLVFFNFALGAHLLFGHKLREWSQLTRAMNAGFRALMGDFDQQSIYAIAPFSSTCWFWLYMGIIYLILMNVFIAIVLDAYTKVKPNDLHGQGSVLSDLAKLGRTMSTKFRSSNRVEPADAPDESSGTKASAGDDDDDDDLEAATGGASR